MQISRYKHLMSNRYSFFFLPFVLGVISSQKLTIGGEVYLGEFLAIFTLFFRIRFQQFSLLEMRVFKLALLWSASQLLSDIINKTLLIDSVKGVLSPTLFALSMLGLITFFRTNLSRMPSFLLGITTGPILTVLINPDEYAQNNLWKWGLGIGVIGLFAIYNSFFQVKKSILFQISVPTIFFIVSILLDSRSLAIFPFLSMVAYLIFRSNQYLWIQKYFGGRWGITRLLTITIPLILIANLTLSLAFSSATVLSNFSDEASKKYKIQATGTYGLLLGGRSEILISSRAFLDSPWIGNGSWAKDKTGKYLNEYYAKIFELGYSLEDFDSAGYELGLIPVHSYLMGGFVWAGILGGFFWLYLLNQSIKTFIRFCGRLPYYYYLGIFLLTWNILFSPFGASARWNTAVFLASYFVVIFELSKQNKVYA